MEMETGRANKIGEDITPELNGLRDMMRDAEDSLRAYERDGRELKSKFDDVAMQAEKLLEYKNIYDSQRKLLSDIIETADSMAESAESASRSIRCQGVQK